MATTYDEKVAAELEQKVFETADAFDKSKSAYKAANKEFWQYMYNNHGFYIFLKRVRIAHNLVFLAIISYLMVFYIVQKFYAENRDFKEWVEVAVDEALVEEYHHLNGQLPSRNIGYKFQLVKDELAKREIDPYETTEDGAY